jgi:hypothetical protein
MTIFNSYVSLPEGTTHFNHMDETLQLVTSAMSLTPIPITALRHSAFYSPLL